MKTIIKLRKQLGFSQEDMARCLGVTRSMLYRAEECTGDLPTAAYHKMADLNKYIEQSEEMEEIPVSGEDELLKKYQWQEQDCLYRIMSLQRKLKKLDNAYATHQEALKVLEIMERKGDVYPLWIEVAKINAKKKLAKCSPLIRAEVERKIVGLEAEASYIRGASQKLKVKMEKRESEKESESANLIAFEGAVQPPSYERLDKLFQPSIMPEHFALNNFNLEENIWSTILKPHGPRSIVHRPIHGPRSIVHGPTVASRSNPPPLPVSG